jgi:hypothetical protein
MASPSTMVPSVKILALKVNFGVLKEVKMLASILRCFPNVDTLHIEVTFCTFVQSVISHLYFQSDDEQNYSSLL